MSYKDTKRVNQLWFYVFGNLGEYDKVAELEDNKQNGR